MSDFLATTRREFLAAAAGASAVIGAAGAAAGTTVRPRVLVHDPAFEVPASFVDGAAMTVVALQGDPVRLWRDGLRQTVSDGGPLYGLTLWADLLIFRGLAAELRRHVRVVQQDPATGRFAWMIA